MSPQVSQAAQQLHARIDDISAEIKKLEHNRRLLKRQLNETLDPIARLPLELSSEIFLQSVEFWGEFEAPTRTLLMSICSTWKAIALSIPALWTAIYISFPCDESLTEFLPIWFQRARNRPISVSISLRGGGVNWDRYVSNIIWRHGEQLKYLKLTDYGYQGAEDDYQHIYLFNYLTVLPTSFPLLETLEIRSFDKERLFDSDQILELLRRAPGVVECIACGTFSPKGLHEPFVHPSLRRLTQKKHHWGELEILCGLSLPALEVLSVPMNSDYFDSFSDFLTRSAPPLQALTLGWQLTLDDTDFVRLHECLRLIPSLARLKMRGPRNSLCLQIVAQLFAALADSSLLPNLSSLTIIMTPSKSVDPPPVISDSAWRTLLRVVSTRRMQLHIFPVELPPADVVAAFEELADDGVDINIGLDEYDSSDESADASSDESVDDSSDESAE